MPQGLRQDMVMWQATSPHVEANDYVLPTSTGRKNNPSNLRRDVFHPAIGVANAELEKAGIAAIGPITFHSLRRTYASLRCASGDDIRYTSSQLGHTDVRFTMATYAQGDEATGAAVGAAPEGVRPSA
jgi:integrase